MCLCINFNIAQENNSNKVTPGSLASGHLLRGFIKPQKIYFLIKQKIPKHTIAIHQKGEGFVCFQSSLKTINDPGLQGSYTSIYFKYFLCCWNASKKQSIMLHHQTELLLWGEKEEYLMGGLLYSLYQYTTGQSCLHLN